MTPPVRLLNKARSAHKAGNLKDAEKLCRKLLDEQHLFVQVRILLAQTMIDMGKIDDATSLTVAAANRAHNDPGVQIAAAECLGRLGRHEEAFPFIQKALATNPHNPDYWFKMLRNMLCCALAKANEQEQEHSNKTIVFFLRPPETIPPELLTLATKALQTFPDNNAICALVGEIYVEANHIEAAELCFKRTLDARPAFIVGHHNWLKLKCTTEKFEEILSYYDIHGASVSDNALCMRVVAAAHDNLGNDIQALEFIQKAILNAPKNIDYIASRGRTLLNLGQFEKALEDLNYAVDHAEDPTAAGNNRRLVNQALGNIAEAAKDEPYRFKLFGTTPIYNFSTPLWEGQPLSGKRLMIWADEGIGDVFKFGTMIKELCHECQVVLLAQPKTTDFLKAALPDVEVRPLPKRIKKNMKNSRQAVRLNADQQLAQISNEKDYFTTFEHIEEDCDFQIPMGRLYAHLRPNIASFKKKTTPFSLPAPIIRRYAGLDILADEECTRVGIAWESSTVTSSHQRRNLSPQSLIPVFKLPGFKFYSFQYTLGETEIDAMQEEYDIPLYHAPGLDLFQDMLGTAAFASCMDLFVGPSSTSSDIAGSMGVKCYRVHVMQSVVNLGQPFVPWYVDQKSVRVPPPKKAIDFVPDMKDWLLANKSHRGKYREL